MGPLIALLVLCPPAVTLGYVSFCLASPWGTCKRCRPGGKNRTCRACNGTGMRPRIGWQLYVYARRLHRDGTR
ncbi:hypothetical protein [Sphaerisporangium fuscum]|uniref:hypothetical protein n=1 Tax=Sphaerisporangium fuscum TaxID=2835868 RepID=UPI001BDC21B7|nr:hypothetical protein [Sphaerisporangium fuscum]